MPMPDLPGTPPQTQPAVRDLAHLMRGSSLGAVGASVELPIAPNAPFFLRHHPRAWQVSATLDEPTWLPEVTKHVLAPGVNGVRTLGEHDEPKDAYEQSVFASTRLGWVYLSPLEPIPDDCLPAGVPRGLGYLRELDCRDPISRMTGTHHIEAWQVPIETLPGEEQQWRWDRESYERWLAYLVRSGQIAPPMPRVLAPLIERQRGRVERARTLNLEKDLRDERVARKREILARYESAALTPSASAGPLSTERSSEAASSPSSVPTDEAPSPPSPAVESELPPDPEPPTPKPSTRRKSS